MASLMAELVTGESADADRRSAFSHRGVFEMKRLSSMFLNPPNGGLALGFSFVLLIFALVPAFAHGDFDHIRGTVVKVANNVLSIKTTKGTVEVKLDNHTDLTRNDRKAQLTDL